MSSWKRDFASGLIVLIPILVSAYIVGWVFVQLTKVPFPNVGFGPVGKVALVIVMFVLLVFSLGYFMRTAFGDVVEAALDDLVNRVPGLRVVYNASKMAVETAVSGADELQTPVKLETWGGLRMTAFKTGRRTKDGRDVLFLPTAPNITTGFVIEVEPENYEEIDERVEDALTRILSAGFGEDSQDRISVDLVGEGEESGTVTDD